MKMIRYIPLLILSAIAIAEDEMSPNCVMLQQNAKITHSRGMKIYQNNDRCVIENYDSSVTYKDFTCILDQCVSKNVRLYVKNNSLEIDANDHGLLWKIVGWEVADTDTSTPQPLRSFIIETTYPGQIILFWTINPTNPRDYEEFVNKLSEEEGVIGVMFSTSAITPLNELVAYMKAAWSVDTVKGLIFCRCSD